MSCPCDHAGHAPDVGNEEPRFGARDGFLPVLRYPAASPKPRTGALDNPATRDDLEALPGVRAFDDLQGLAPDLFQGPLSLGPV